ncbi:MAG: VWA domain-containing protein [bacterium]
MRRFFAGMFFAVLFLGFSAFSQAASRIEFILDVSGSMNARFGDTTRIAAARKAIETAVGSIPDGTTVALRLYAHRVSPNDKAGSCKDTQLVIPFGPINKQQIVSTANQAMPLGQTPIAYSLEQAAADFNPGADEQPVIILVSDGEESCGGDPIAVAKGLIAKGYKLKINTIGIDVDPNAKAQLEGIATSTGGVYKDARDAASLTSSLQQLTQDSLLIKKEQSVYGDPIRGGNSYETAVALTPSKLFHLDHHQRINQFDYFYVDAKAGQKIVTFIETGDNGVTINGDQATVNTNPYAGIALHGPTRQQIEREELIGASNKRKTISFSVPTGGDGRYYILVGSTYDNQNKDNRFQVDMASQFDANTNQDAGDTDATALEIAPGTYEKNYLSGSDNTDVFKVNLNPNTPYEIKARPTVANSSGSTLEGVILIEVYDADGVKLAEGKSPNNGALAKIDNLVINKAGPVFIRVKDYWKSTAETTYSLSISPVGTMAGGESQPSAVPPSAPPPVVATPPAPSATPAAPPAASVPVSATGEPDIGKALSGLTLLQKAKWLGKYVLGPGFGIFFFGLLFGYVWGRRSGKRKTLAKLAKQAPPAAK